MMYDIYYSYTHILYMILTPSFERTWNMLLHVLLQKYIRTMTAIHEHLSENGARNLKILIPAMVLHISGVYRQ
jgi:hypothetical protein